MKSVVSKTSISDVISRNSFFFPIYFLHLQGGTKCLPLFDFVYLFFPLEQGLRRVTRLRFRCSSTVREHSIRIRKRIHKAKAQWWFLPARRELLLCFSFKLLKINIIASRKSTNHLTILQSYRWQLVRKRKKGRQRKGYSIIYYNYNILYYKFQRRIFSVAFK